MIIYLQMLEDLSDRDKFTLLYNKYRRLMLYVANQILNNQDDSEDAVHEAFLSIIRNIKKIQDTDRPETRSYIVIITERKAINILQKRSSAIPYDESNELMGIAIPAPGDFGIADALSQLPGIDPSSICERIFHQRNCRSFGNVTEKCPKSLVEGQKAIRTKAE